MYDPATDSWSTLKSMPDNSCWDVAIEAVGGKIYALGGYAGGQNLSREYDPATDTWTYRAAIPRKHAWGHASAVLDDEIYVIGGSVGRMVDIYDPATDTWRKGAKFPGSPYSGLAAAALGGFVYVVGTGLDLHVYDPVTDSWGQGAQLPVYTRVHAATVHGEKLYVFGGSSRGQGGGGDLRTVQVYDPANDVWTLLSDMPSNRYWTAAVALSDSIHVFGGLGSANTGSVSNEELR